MNLTKIKFLLTLKNSSLVKKEYILTLFFKKNYDIIYILYKEGIIQSFNLQNFNKKIIIYLRYYYNKILLNSLKIISKPSNTKFLKIKDLYKLNIKKKLFILSTSKGLKTLLDCKKSNLGGKLLFIC